MRKEKLPKRMKRAEGTREHMDEAQSTFRSASPPPLFMGSAIQMHIDESFWKVLDELKSREEERWKAQQAREDEHRKALIETLGRSFIHISQTQAQALRDITSLKQDVRSLYTDVSYLQDLFTAHISPEIPAHSPSSQHSSASIEPLKSLESPSITFSPAPDTQHTPILTPTTKPLTSDSSFFFTLLDPPSSQPVHVTPAPDSTTNQPISNSTPVLHFTPDLTHD